MKWINIPKDISKYHGFCYCITYKPTGKRYIGKKFYWKNKILPPLKGKKNRRHSRVESDWKTYWGSSKELLKDIEKYGKKAFTREILMNCATKWEVSYNELLYQINYNVLFRKDCYNGIIQVRLPKAPKHLRK